LNKEEMRAKVQDRASEIRSRYTASASRFQNFLVYGDFGTGKTSLLSTCPRPVFVDSFDPGGTKTRSIQPLIESGDIVVENKWETDSWKSPWAFAEWERTMREREREGFFDFIGTYVIDSLTRWAMSLMYEVLKRGSKKTGARTGTTPEIQDYLTQQLTAADYLGALMDYPCHVVCTGHIGLEKDEVSGRTQTGLLMWGKMATQTPLVFDEKYITKVEAGRHVLLTQNDGIWQAETRMGGGLFDKFEDQDIKELLVKAGKDASDKESLFSKEEKK